MSQSHKVTKKSTFLHRLCLKKDLRKIVLNVVFYSPVLSPFFPMLKPYLVTRPSYLFKIKNYLPAPFPYLPVCFFLLRISAARLFAVRKADIPNLRNGQYRTSHNFARVYTGNAA